MTEKKEDNSHITGDASIFRELFDLYDSFLKDRGGDLRYFIKRLKQYNRHERNYKFTLDDGTLKAKQEKRRLRRRRAIAVYKRKVIKKLRQKEYPFVLDAQMSARFRILCLAEKVDPRILLEAIMNAFIEGDDSIIELMENIQDYHKKPIFLYKRLYNFKYRLKKIKNIKDFYNIPEEWFKKYADLRPDYLEF